MKFFVALILSVLIAVIAIVRDNSSARADNAPANQKQQILSSFSGENLSGTFSRFGKTTTEAMNKVFLLVVAGFALGKLFHKTKDILSGVSALFLISMVVLLIILSKTDLIIFEIQWQNFLKAFSWVKDGVGVVNFASVVLGLWSGIFTGAYRA